jgi:hypothetical protein
MSSRANRTCSLPVPLCGSRSLGSPPLRGYRKGSPFPARSFSRSDPATSSATVAGEKDSPKDLQDLTRRVGLRTVERRYNRRCKEATHLRSDKSRVACLPLNERSYSTMISISCCLAPVQTFVFTKTISPSTCLRKRSGQGRNGWSLSSEKILVAQSIQMVRRGRKKRGGVA